MPADPPAHRPAALENPPVLLVAFDSDNRVIIWNKACEGLLGWTRQEVQACADARGLIFPPRTPPEDAPALEPTPDGRFRETLVRTRDGRHLSQRWAFHRLPDGTDIGLGYDSTEQHRIEKELSRSEELLRIFVRNVTAAIAMLDRNMIYLAASRHYCMSLRLDPDQIIGRSHYDLLPDIKPQWYEEHRLALAGEIRRGEESWVRADGQTEWLWWELRPWRDDTGEIGGLLTSGEIITAQKKMEAELRQAKVAAENASRAKSEFLANISHELRTPLSSIFGLTEMTLSTRLSQEQRTNLEMIKESAGSLLQIINDLLDISRIEAREIPFQMTLFDLRQTVAAIVDPFRPLARRKGLRLQLRIAPAIPRTIVGDPERVGQVIRNLLSNAIKFTRQGSVSLTIQKVDGESGATGLLFRVRDTGIGIAPADHGRLFQNFSQIRGSYDKEFEGTGLGLAISKKLVEAMGGRIWLDRDSQNGCTFFFRLDFLHAPEPAAAKATPEPRKSAPLILLAEDHAPNRKYLLHFLKQGGFRVISAQDGYEVLSILEKTPVDLVMMDMQMPGMDGLKATHRIRASANPCLRKVPIIAVTAYARNEDQQRFLAAGVNRCLTKPVHIPLLMEEILRLTGESVRAAEEPLAVPDETPPFDPDEMKTRWRKHPGLLKEICSTFLEESPEMIHRLEMHAAGSDWPEVMKTAHQIQNLAAMIPLPDVIRVSRHIEEAAGTSEPQAVLVQIRRLSALARDARQSIARVLSEVMSVETGASFHS